MRHFYRTFNAARLLSVMLFFATGAFSLNAQDVAAIDRLRGFEEMEFGDSYAEWQDKVELIDEMDNGSKVYRLKEAPAAKIFGFPIKTADLVFSKNKLISIKLFCTPWSVPMGEDTTAAPDSATVARYCSRQIRRHSIEPDSKYGSSSITVGPQTADATGAGASTWIAASIWKGNRTWLHVGTVYMAADNSGWTFFHFEDRTVR